MNELLETCVSLRFFGDDLDPEEITRRLGAQPTLGVAKGAPWMTGSGETKASLHGKWLLKAPARRPGDLDGQIAALLAPMSDDLEAWRELARRFRGDIFAGLFLDSRCGGVGLSSETLATLGERGLFLGLDIYSPEEADESSSVDG